MIAGLQLGSLHGLELLRGEQGRHLPIRQDDGSFGADQHGRLRRIGLGGNQGLHVGGRIEEPVKPLHRNLILLRHPGSGKDPGDVVALRPGVSPANLGLLPRLLHPGAHGLGRGKPQGLPGRIKDMTSDIPRPTCPEIEPRTPLGGMIDAGSIGSDRCRPGPEIPVEVIWRLLRLPGAGTNEAVALDRTWPIRAQHHSLDLPDHSALDPVDEGAVPVAGGGLGSKLRLHPRLAGGLGQQTHLRHIMTEGLLAVDMLATLDRGHGD